jgi:hypothetical protein
MLKSLKRLNPLRPVIRALLYSSVTGCLFCAPNVLAQAPPVVVDAQQTIGSGYSNPRSVAAGKNGAVYVADQNNNRVLQLITNLPAVSTQTQVATTGYTLAGPTALAVDENGDLFIGDYPSILGIGVTRIIECLATNGVLNGNVNLVYQGGVGSLLSQPISLAVDRKNTVFVGLTGLAAGIYSIASGSGTATKLNITGLPAGFTPAELVRDASTGLYIVNSAASSGGVYFATVSGTGNPVAILWLRNPSAPASLQGWPSIRPGTFSYFPNSPSMAQRLLRSWTSRETRRPRRILFPAPAWELRAEWRWNRTGTSMSWSRPTDS